MRPTKNHISRRRQISIGREGQGESGVRTAVDPAAHLVVDADDEPVEKRVARAILEALGAWVG